MNRPLAAALAFSAVLSLDPGVHPADAGSVYPQSVFRLRGGIAHPDPPGGDGHGWCAGGSAGFVLNRNVLVSLSYDHIAMGETMFSGDRPSVSPVTLDLELGMPTEHHITPRIAAGVGPYFHDNVTYAYTGPYGGPPQRLHSLTSTLGAHFGVGLSIPAWKRTLVDVDYRYHQGSGDDNFAVGTLSAGLRYLVPIRSGDSEGYVLARESALAGL